MKIALFGSTGFVGKELLEKGIEQGHQFKVLVRNPQKLGEFAKKVEIVDAIAIDASGNQISLISTSEPNGYLRKGITLKPGEILAKGSPIHAEVDIVNYIKQKKLKLVSIGATRPVCPACAKAISPTGAKIVTPLK